MNINSVTIGMPVLAKIGSNVIRATVLQIINDRVAIVRNLRTNNDFTTAIAKLEPDPEGVASAEETAPAATPEAPKKRTLLSIAYEVMGSDRRPMSTAEILDIAQERGIFNPADWGHTPTLTLYGTFVREAKKESPKVRKSETRGKWELVAPAEAETPAN